MAYDERVAARIREALAGEGALTEKKMFGGLGFMIAGTMAATLGNFTLAAGDRSVVGVSRWTSARGLVLADAIRLTRVS